MIHTKVNPARMHYTFVEKVKVSFHMHPSAVKGAKGVRCARPKLLP